MHFVWDSIKEVANLEQHGIDFSTAALAFSDPQAVEVYDAEHSSEHEDRWTTIGLVAGVLMLVRLAGPRDRALYQSR